MRSRQRCGARGAAVATGACFAGASDRSDDPVLRIDEADRVVLGVYNEHVAGWIDRHLLRCIEHGMARIVAITAVAACAGPGHRFDDPIAHAPQAAALALQDVDGTV